MRESELFTLLEGAYEAAFITNAAGRILFWGKRAEELFGRPAADVIGTPCCAVLEGRDAAGVRLCMTDCSVRALLRKGSPVAPYDLEVRVAGGERRWVNVSILPANVGTPGQGCVVHLLRDIQDRKQLETLTGDLLGHIERLSGLPVREAVAARRGGLPHPDLTTQERRVLGLMILGRSTKSMAGELSISPATVRNHVQHILDKLGVHSRLEAVQRAVREPLP